jgi:hypothetical protein
MRGQLFLAVGRDNHQQAVTRCIGGIKGFFRIGSPFMPPYAF